FRSGAGALAAIEGVEHAPGLLPHRRRHLIEERLLHLRLEVAQRYGTEGVDVEAISRRQVELGREQSENDTLSRVTPFHDLVDANPPALGARLHVHQVN